MQYLGDIAIGLTLFSLAAYVALVGAFALALLRSRRRPAVRATETFEMVSVLKPLAGCDDDLAANLASFARLEGPRHEVLFGVASVRDPAYAVARDVMRRFPRLDARLVVTDPDAALNPKVAQLLLLERAARGDVVVVSDSNVRVSPSYLERLCGELARPGVGLVSSLIAGTGERSLGAALENLIIGTHVTPGVLAGYAITGRAITIGKSMAMRRRDLARVGGFESVASVLAEDHALARAFRAAGMNVAVCTEAVENRNVVCSMGRSIERHTRWAKIRRAMEPAGFVLEPLLLPVVVASAALVVSPSHLGLALLLASVTVQTAGAWLGLRLLRGRAMPLHWAPLEVVRSYVLVLCWARAWLSRRVSWRGHDLIVGLNTELSPAPPSAMRRVLGYPLRSVRRATSR